MSQNAFILVALVVALIIGIALAAAPSPEQRKAAAWTDATQAAAEEATRNRRAQWLATHAEVEVAPAPVPVAAPVPTSADIHVGDHVWVTPYREHGRVMHIEGLLYIVRIKHDVPESRYFRDELQVEAP